MNGIDFDKIDLTLSEAIAICDLLSAKGEETAEDTVPAIGLLLVQMLMGIKKELEK